MTKLGIVFGTRPEAIKLGPVAAELRAHGTDFTVLATGQHTDLLAGSPAESDLADSVALGLTTTDQPVEWVAYATGVLERAFQAHGITHVAVQGDTVSALAGMRAARQAGLPVAHIEAGVRSFNGFEPWPEEIIRAEIDEGADLLLAATPQAQANVRGQGVLTGNSVVSALARYTGARPSPAANPLTILVTLHRRELRLHPRFGTILGTLFAGCEMWSNFVFLWPVHPGMRTVLGARLPPTNLHLVAPLPYRACAERLATCHGLLTDSGGLVEEAATLGVPTAILRNVNDRPEAEAAGIARRFDADASGVRLALLTLAMNQIPRQPSDVFGTPESAGRIAEALMRWLASA